MNGEAGKGDKLRSGANLNLYWENYDNIFRKKKNMYYYDIKTAKEGDVFYECQYGINIKMVALEDVRFVVNNNYSGGGGYELRVKTDDSEITISQSKTPGAYGLRLFKEPQYIGVVSTPVKN